MSYDRFIRWQSELRPTQAEVLLLIQDYFGEALVSADWKGSRWNVLLHGRKSVAVRNLPGCPPSIRAVAEEEKDDERFLEVFFDEQTANHFSIITRHADEYTGAVAEGLAQLIARLWNGKVEQG